MKSLLHSFALLSFSLALLASGACSSGLRCGAGTVELGGECQAVADGGPESSLGDAANEGAVPDGAGTDGAGPTDATVPDDFVSLLIDSLDGLSVGGVPVQPVGINVPTTFGVYGTYHDGTYRLLTEGVTFSVLPAGSGVGLRVHDGVVEVTPTRAGDVQLVATATTASGLPLSTTRLLTPSEAHAPALAAITVQDGSWFGLASSWIATVDNVFANLMSSEAPLLPATAPSGGGVRVMTALSYALTVRGSDGVDRTLNTRSLLDPAAVTYHASAGTLEQPGLLRSSVPADAELTVSYTLVGAPLSATTRARFVAPSASRGLLLTHGELLVHWTMMSPLPARSFGAGSLGLASFTDGTLSPETLSSVSFFYTQAGHVLRIALVAVHGNGADEYFEWLPWSSVRLEVLDNPATFTVDGDGVFQQGTPGVGAWIAHAGGFDLPGLTQSPYTPSSGFAFRIAPSPIALTSPARPSDPSACVTLSAFVTPAGGVERPLTALERLALSRYEAGGLSSVPLDMTRTGPLDYCVVYFGGPARTATYNFNFLGLGTHVDARVTPGT